MKILADLKPSTWVEIDLDAIAHNYAQAHHLSKNILAVVKADAYGHGAKEVALLLDSLDVAFLGVSDVQEGTRLRSFGIRKPVLLFESTLEEHIPAIIEEDLTPTVCTLDFAQKLNIFAKSAGKSVNVHVEVDTGMGRLGVSMEDALAVIQTIGRMDHLTVEGIFTHFPVPESDLAFTENQIRQLSEVAAALRKTGQEIPFVHAANSMGLIGYKAKALNLARPGLMLYGLYPQESARPYISLKPAMSVKSKVLFVKNVKKGSGLSYGRTFKAPKDMTVATLAIGYNDGYPRALSNKAAVLIGGLRCPVLGTVTMDQIMVDVSAVGEVAVGEEAVILGRQDKEEMTAEELAREAGTISYEIVCNFGNRLQRNVRSKSSTFRSSAPRSS